MNPKRLSWTVAHLTVAHLLMMGYPILKKIVFTFCGWPAS